MLEKVYNIHIATINNCSRTAWAIEQILIYEKSNFTYEDTIYFYFIGATVSFKEMRQLTHLSTEFNCTGTENNLLECTGGGNTTVA